MHLSHRRWPSPRAAALLIALTSLLSSGCATAPAGIGEEVSDPQEKVNRAVYGFNSGVDRYFMKPLAKGYQFVMPDVAEKGVHNFFVNLRTPLEAANSLLQGKPRDAGANATRFLLNSTFGIGGLVDVAAIEGIERRQEDFGQTLAVWGVPAGPLIMVPFAGPATLRDLVGLEVDSFGAPLIDQGLSYENSSVRDKLFVLRLIDIRAQFIGPDAQIEEAFDPYAFLRSAYAQRRDFLIFDGDPPEEEFDDEFFDDE